MSWKTFLFPHRFAMCTHNTNAPNLYTISEAAAMLRLSATDLRRITHPRGPLQVVRIGRVVRYTAQALREYQKRTAD